MNCTCDDDRTCVDCLAQERRLDAAHGRPGFIPVEVCTTRQEEDELMIILPWEEG